MAISEYVSGTETVTSSSEWSLTTDSSGAATDTTDGIFQVFLSLATLTATTSAGTDTYRFRTYEKVTSGSSQGLVYEAFVAGAQGSPNWVSPSLVLLHGWDATLLKISGENRSIDWSIRKVS